MVKWERSRDTREIIQTEEEKNNMASVFLSDVTAVYYVCNNEQTRQTATTKWGKKINWG